MKYLGEIEDPKDLVTKEYIFNAIYPVGSIYMSVNATSPETLFGGTWQKLKGNFCSVRVVAIHLEVLAVAQML